MRTSSSLSLASLVLLSSIAAALGCAPSGDRSTSDDQAATGAEDLALAKDVVAMLGGSAGKCKECHGVTEAKIKAWGTSLAAVDAACFAPAGLTAKQRMDCLRSDPTNPTSPFSPKRLGLYAAGVQQDQFKSLFNAQDYATFAQHVAMPRGGGPPIDAASFAKIKGWALRGMPQLAQAFGAPVVPDPTAACTPSSSPELQAHIASMKTQGWGARLADQSTPMFGCAAGATGSACLTSLPNATTTFGATNVQQTMRTLINQELESHYWVRSSADGRYVGMGFNSSARIIDLKNTAKPIEVEADYDPFFLPSNDGFAFAGSHKSGAIVLCKQSLLSDVATDSTPRIGLDESKCATMQEQVYMSIGSSLDGQRYFMTFGQHANDDGGNDITAQMPADFGLDSTTAFTPMVNNGLSYKAQPGVVVKLPNEGDMMLSPSTKLAATRFGDDTHSLGYKIHMVKPSATATGGLAVDLPVAATVCVPGQKANISFDERFMATHQYVDTTQPDQAQLPAGSSNVIVTDLVTGKTIRITTSKRNQFALYPHFRADGWLYFLVRDMAANKEYLVASDVVLRIEAGTP